MGKKHFISKAIRNPGALTRTAQAAGKTVAEFIAHPPKGASAKTKRRIALAKTLRKLRKRRKQ